jgi:hypothetical protein
MSSRFSNIWTPATVACTTRPRAIWAPTSASERQSTSRRIGRPDRVTGGRNQFHTPRGKCGGNPGKSKSAASSMDTEGLPASGWLMETARRRSRYSTAGPAVRSASRPASQLNVTSISPSRNRSKGAITGMSRRTTGLPGWRASNAATSRFNAIPSVVMLKPIRNGPAICCAAARVSSTAARSCAYAGTSRSRSCCPSGVRRTRRLVRSNSVPPTSRSRAATDRLTFGWVNRSRSAVRPKWSSSARTRNTSICARSIGQRHWRRRRSRSISAGLAASAMARSSAPRAASGSPAARRNSARVA